MRGQTFLSLVVGAALGGALCLPLAAQNDMPASGAAQAPAQTPAVQPEQSPAAQPAAEAPVTGNAAASADTQDQLQPLGQPPKQGFWGRMNPFARKKYVNNQLTPIRDRVNELDDLTTKNAQDVSNLDARSQAAIAQAQGQADQANQTANAAQQEVQQDADLANQLNQRYDATDHDIQSVDQYEVAQTAELNFNHGSATLSPDAQQQLSNFLQGLDSQHGYVVEVKAYSTLHGRAGLDNSQRLADAVVRYLVLQANIPLYRVYTMGMGDATPEASATPAGDASGAAGTDGAGQMTPAAAPRSSGAATSTQGGRVEVRILRNSVTGAQPNAGGQR